MFELLSDAENEGDPCIAYMREGTDEAKKVLRKQGQIWHAVFRKRDINNSEDKAKITQEMMKNFFS